MSKREPQANTTGATRRDFIKRSAAVAAGAATLSVAQHAHAAGDETIRIGLVGCGGRGTRAAEQAMKAGPYVKLVAMADVFKDQVENSRTTLKSKCGEQVQVGDDHCFTGLDGYKHVLDASDVVLIACASKFSAMYAEDAIKAGKHVFVEKPHGIDPVGVRRMKTVCELAKTKGLSLMSGLHSRWHAGWRETIPRIHDGIIGDVVAIQTMFLRAPYQIIPRQPGWSEMEYQFRNWYHFCWLSGDDVPQSLVHNMDRCSWILKEAQPKWAFGMAGRSASFGEQFGDMFDHHTVVYEYDSGVHVYAMCRTQADTYYQYNDVILGSKGRCNLETCEITGETKWKYTGPANDPHLAEQLALIEAVRTGKPFNSGYHMCDSTMIGVLGQIAAYSGKYVTLSEMWRSDFSFGPLPDGATMSMEAPTKPGPDGNYPLPKPGVTQLAYKPA